MTRFARLAVAWHVLSFLAIWVVLLTLGGVTGLLVWYTVGGVFMHAVAVLSVVQLIVGLLVTRRHLRAPVPMAAHLAMPSVIIVVGVAGNLVGLHQAADYLVTSVSDQTAGFWGEAAAISATPQTFAYLVAAFGCIAAAGTATAGLALRSRAVGRGRATIRSLLIWVLSGVGLVLTALLVPGLFVWQATSGPGLLALAWPTALAVIGVVLFAINAGSVRALSKGDETDTSTGFHAALLCVVAVVSAVVAMCSGHRLQFLGTLIHQRGVAPPDEPELWFVAPYRAATAYVATTAGAVSLGVAVLLLGAGVLVLARRGASAWAAKHLADAVVVLALAGAVLTASWLPSHDIRSQLDILRARKAHLMPHRVDLPISTSDRLRWGRRTVELVGPQPGDMRLVGDSGYQLYLDGRRYGYGLPSAEVSADGKPTVVDRLSWTFHQPAWTSPYSDDCQLGVMTLAIDRGSPAHEIEGFARRWRARGGCQLELLVDEPTEQRQRVENRFGLYGDFEAACYVPNAIDLYLASEVRARQDFGDDSRRLVLNVTETAIRIATGRGEEQVLDRKDGALPLEQLRGQLLAIKDASPDERAVFLRATGKSTMQDFVSVLDAARKTADSNGDARLLFDEAVWLLSDASTTGRDSRAGAE